MSGAGYRGIDCRSPETTLTSSASAVAIELGGRRMYGHSHTGIGALMLTLIAGAKGGIGYLVRAMASPHW